MLKDTAQYTPKEYLRELYFQVLFVYSTSFAQKTFPTKLVQVFSQIAFFFLGHLKKNIMLNRFDLPHIFFGGCTFVLVPSEYNKTTKILVFCPCNIVLDVSLNFSLSLCVFCSRI